jgi:hypothetical protein
MADKKGEFYECFDGEKVFLKSMKELYDTGNLIGAKEISKKNYHIPVPSNKKYEDYLHGFFNFLENCMSSSLEKVEEQEETKNG